MLEITLQFLFGSCTDMYTSYLLRLQDLKPMAVGFFVSSYYLLFWRPVQSCHPWKLVHVYGTSVFL